MLFCATQRVIWQSDAVKSSSGGLLQRLLDCRLECRPTVSSFCGDVLHERFQSYAVSRAGAQSGDAVRSVRSVVFTFGSGKPGVAERSSPVDAGRGKDKLLQAARLMQSTHRTLCAHVNTPSDGPGILRQGCIAQIRMSQPIRASTHQSHCQCIASIQLFGLNMQNAC